MAVKKFFFSKSYIVKSIKINAIMQIYIHECCEKWNMRFYVPFYWSKLLWEHIDLEIIQNLD